MHFPNYDLLGRDSKDWPVISDFSSTEDGVNVQKISGDLRKVYEGC